MRRQTTPALALLLALLPAGVNAQAIDEFRLSDIEQNLRSLQSTVREQARQIAELQRQSGQRAFVPATPSGGAADVRWVNSASWSRLQPGMSELQVLELLGPPSQQRLEADRSRSLLYALEIGRSGFLSGRVTLLDGKVSAIELPSLK